MNPLRQTSQLSYKTSYGNLSTARPAARRADLGLGVQGGRDPRPAAPLQPWRNTPEPPIAPFGVANDKGHAEDRDFRFGSGPAPVRSSSRATRKLLPVLGVGALSLAVLAGGVAYFTVFAAGDMPALVEAKPAVVTANGSVSGAPAPSGPAASEHEQIVAEAIKPVAVKTVTISPELLDKGIMAPNLPGDSTSDTAVANARWGYKTDTAPKATPGTGAPAQQTAYASINAAAAKPWPVTSQGSDAATDETAAATPAVKPEKKAEPVKSDPAPVALEKAKYQDMVNDHVNMRTGPRSRSDVITVVPKGSTVGVIECRSWCKVVYDGRQGWVYKRYIGNSQAAAPAAAETQAAAPEDAPEKTEPTLIQRIISGGDQMSTR